MRFVRVSALGVRPDRGAAYGETKARAAGLLRSVAARAARMQTVAVEPSLLFGDGSEIIRALDMASRLPRPLTRLLVRIVSHLKPPGAPAELEAMLALDNAGSPPERPDELITFTRWAAAQPRAKGR